MHQTDAEFDFGPGGVRSSPPAHAIGRERAAAKEKKQIATHVAAILIEHANSALTFAQIYEKVSDATDFSPREADVGDAVRALVDSGQGYVQVARDEYAWAPNVAVPAPTRVLQMIELRRTGSTLDEVGKEFGVTRERVRQLLKKHGGPDAREVRHLREERAEAEEQAQAAAIAAIVRRVFADSGPLTVDEVASRTGLDSGLVARFWPSELAHLRLWAPQHIENRWSDTEILDAIRNAALYEFPLTANAYADLVSAGQVHGPSMPRIWQRFGSWTAACETAGVVPGQTMRPHYQSKWSDDDLLQVVRRYLLDPDAPNSARRFDEWKRDNAPDGPSFATLRNRFGSWTAVKREALATKGCR